MKRRIIIAVLLSLPAVLYAQNEKGFIAHTHFRSGATIGKYDQKYTPVSQQLAAGYAFNKVVSLSLTCDLIADMLEYADTDTNYLNISAGLMLGIDISQPGDSAGWELFASCGSTLGTTSYDYLYGEAGIRIIKRFSNGWSPFFFAGIRYQNAYKAAFDDFFIANVGFGFRFGR